MTALLVITPVTPLVNLETLIGATVQATVFDDPVFKHETYIGEITEVKINKFGTFVYFKTPELVGGKWIKLSRVIGFAHYEEQEITDTQFAILSSLTQFEGYRVFFDDFEVMGEADGLVEMGYCGIYETTRDDSLVYFLTNEGEEFFFQIQKATA